jgi:GDPmannose 4,6-dehydratase
MNLEAKKILIIGGSGQIGFYLSKFLIKNNKIYISTRNKNTTKIKKLKNTCKKAKIINLNILNKKNIIYNIKKINPDYIFYLAGQSSVEYSFKKKKETLLSNYLGCKNVLDAIIELNIDIKFFNASSSEIYGNNKKIITISTKKEPVSPYGKAKLKSFNLVRHYRKKYNLKLYNGIIFNCESNDRPKNYVFPKICISALLAKKQIQKEVIKKFEFGNINIKRDWGWCEEYVKFIWQNIQKKPKDFIIATGKSFFLYEIIKCAFDQLNLNWLNHIVINKKLFRKKEIFCVQTKILNAKKKTIKNNGKDIIIKMLKFYKKNYF